MLCPTRPSVIRVLQCTPTVQLICQILGWFLVSYPCDILPALDAIPFFLTFILAFLWEGPDPLRSLSLLYPGEIVNVDLDCKTIHGADYNWSVLVSAGKRVCSIQCGSHHSY